MITLLSLPSWALLLFLLVFFIGVGRSTLFVVQKYCKKFKVSERFSVGETAMSGVYALVLAFVTIGVWESHNKLEYVVAKEAGTLLNIYRLLDAYPITMRDEEKARIKIYIQAVINEEWPYMARDEIAAVTVPKIMAILQPIVRYIPANNGEAAVQAESLRLISDYRELHVSRLEGARSLIGVYVWTTLIGSSFIFLLYLCFMNIQSRHLHSILIFLCSSTIAWIFFLLILYDRPFMGPAAISSKPFSVLLNVYMKY
ncbi:MAG: DUF4239 domain-containing protein [Gammaproteobacteria bacterium]|nr:DUF4239 domain-containing protein [Gammaproteobacteria bacterium]